MTLPDSGHSLAQSVIFHAFGACLSCTGMIAPTAMQMVGGTARRHKGASPDTIPFFDEGTSLSSSAKGLAGRYAGALYALAEEAGKVDAVVADLTGLGELVAGNDEVKMLCESPAISWSEQTKAMTAIMEKGGADALTVKFVGTVASNGRLHALTRIISAFLAEHARRRGQVSAEVISAIELDAARRARVETAVAKLAGSDKISLSMRVDPSLIGGLVVRIGSRMIDTSVKTKLNRLETAMKGIA